MPSLPPAESTPAGPTAYPAAGRARQATLLLVSVTLYSKEDCGAQPFPTPRGPTPTQWERGLAVEIRGRQLPWKTEDPPGPRGWVSRPSGPRQKPGGAENLCADRRKMIWGDARMTPTPTPHPFPACFGGRWGNILVVFVYLLGEGTRVC